MIKANVASFGRVLVYMEPADLQRLLDLVTLAQDEGLDETSVGLELMTAVVEGRVLEDTGESPVPQQLQTE